MLVAVTGAAGFIGSHVCERLLAAGDEVRGLDAFTRFYARALKEANVAGLRRTPGFALVERNLLDRGLAEQLRGADAVVHLAGRPGVRQDAGALYEAGNVATTDAVVEAAAESGVRRVLLASSSSVYGEARGAAAEDAPLRPLSRYGESKRRAELRAGRRARSLGLELVVLRYFTVYGPRQRPDMAFARYADAVLGGREMPLIGDGGQVRDFTYVGDAAEATVLALTRGRPGAVYNVAGGRPASVRDALALLAPSLGAEARTTFLPADPRDPRATVADLRCAQRELGYDPRTTLSEGLRRQAAHACELAA